MDADTSSLLSQKESDCLAYSGPTRDVALGRPGALRGMANAVSFLASYEAAFVCGTALLVDGGMKLGRD
ncbi:hypothetical protein L596_025712 [Steinernema carpocapsae]|uniref:Uncharacterized protein n=1 Tax=Steinernema carpocapsae TaxID=34508 RepID=A0A4V5ZYW0_STECR|nr:hypothetical protein L596_025712 [Steinernema carpocapsae]